MLKPWLIGGKVGHLGGSDRGARGRIRGLTRGTAGLGGAARGAALPDALRTKSSLPEGGGDRLVDAHRDGARTGGKGGDVEGIDGGEEAEAEQRGLVEH